jgi:hypothetical protein
MHQQAYDRRTIVGKESGQQNSSFFPARARPPLIRRPEIFRERAVGVLVVHMDQQGFGGEVLLPVSVTIAGQSTNPLYVGGSPGQIDGLTQINFQVPDTTRLACLD